MTVKIMKYFREFFLYEFSLFGREAFVAPLKTIDNRI